MSLQLYEIWNWLCVVPMKRITSNCKSSKFNEIGNALRLSLACQLPSQLFPSAGNDRCSSKWTWWWRPQNLKMPRNIEKLQASATHKNELCRRKDTELDRKKEKQDKCTHHHLIIHPSTSHLSSFNHLTLCKTDVSCINGICSVI